MSNKNIDNTNLVIGPYTEPVVITAPSGKYFDKIAITLENA